MSTIDITTLSQSPHIVAAIKAVAEYYSETVEHVISDVINSVDDDGSITLRCGTVLQSDGYIKYWRIRTGRDWTWSYYVPDSELAEFSHDTRELTCAHMERFGNPAYANE